MPYIQPSPDQLKALMEMDITGPINMLNLLRYKPNGGRESYAKYSENTVPLVFKRGGKIVYQAQGRTTVIGGEAWDTIVIVEYPTKQAFLDMIQSEEYQRGAHLRSEALEDSRLVCMQA